MVAHPRDSDTSQPRRPLPLLSQRLSQLHSADAVVVAQNSQRGIEVRLCVLKNVYTVYNILRIVKSAQCIVFCVLCSFPGVG